jgi:ABC-type Zn uptake system ZnuABC Zn-binding protein ZnuA
MPRVRALAAALATLTLGAAAAGCGTSPSGATDRLKVVATTTQLGDLTRAVGGNAVDVHQLLRPNTDPHEYEPRPSDLVATARAKVVLTSGDGLDAWMAKIVDQAGGRPEVVDVGATVPVRRPGEASGPEASRYDPHWWHDPVNAAAAVETIRAALTKADPAHRATYDRNAAAERGKIEAMQRALQGCFARVPAAQRKLVTDHDAFGYFAHRFGITIVGAVIPSQTTQAQPSAQSVSRLVAQIRSERVRAIFPETSINAKLADQIASQTGATSSYHLYGDTLGPAGSPGATYVGMELANGDAMVRGFTGGRERCAPVR